MFHRLTVFVLSSTVVFWLPAPVASAEDSLAMIESKCIEMAAKYASASAKIRLSTEHVSGQVNISTEANGTYEHQRKGTKLLFRNELNNIITTRNSFGSRKDEQYVLTISDGVYAFTLTRQKGREASAAKSMPKASQTLLADEPFFQVLKGAYEVKIMPDEQVDGQDVWVIDARPKAPKPGQAAKTLHYIRKDSALRVKSTGHDPTGRRIQLTALTEIKLDESIDARRFIFDPPEGVKVMDLTSGKQ